MRRRGRGEGSIHKGEFSLLLRRKTAWVEVGHWNQQRYPCNRLPPDLSIIRSILVAVAHKLLCSHLFSRGGIAAPLKFVQRICQEVLPFVSSAFFPSHLVEGSWLPILLIVGFVLFVLQAVTHVLAGSRELIGGKDCGCSPSHLEGYLALLNRRETAGHLGFQLVSAVLHRNGGVSGAA